MRKVKEMLFRGNCPNSAHIVMMWCGSQESRNTVTTRSTVCAVWKRQDHVLNGHSDQVSLPSSVSSEGSVIQAALMTARWANYDNMKKDAKNKGCLVLAQVNNSRGNGGSVHKTSNHTEAATVMGAMLHGRVEILFPDIWRLRNIKAIENNCRGKQSGCKETGR